LRLVLASLLLTATLPAATTFLGPTPYLSFADGPLNGVSFSYFFLKTYEDGTLPSTGVTYSPGVTVDAPSPLTDSVDGDDGAIDGVGTAGHSLLATGVNTIMFAFDPTILGALPTRAGIVWTDVGNVIAGTVGIGSVSFTALGPGGVNLGSIGPFTLGDGSASVSTLEDRFFGVVDPAGISAIQITTANSFDWEVDHLQYGLDASAVPEPGTWMLTAFGLLLATRCRNRYLRFTPGVRASALPY
jgi:hypothetical protein